MTETIVEVPFIRKLPTGNGGVQVVPRPSVIGAMARRFLRAGGWYVVEILPIHPRDNGGSERVRLSACDENMAELFGCDTDNGPPLIEAVDRLIQMSQSFIHAR